MSFPMLKEKMNLYKRPINCDKLVIPEFNDEEKEAIDSLQLERNDRSHVISSDEVDNCSH